MQNGIPHVAQVHSLGDFSHQGIFVTKVEANKTEAPVEGSLL